MNKAVEVSIEVIIAMIALGLLVAFVQTAIYTEKKCEGTPPDLNSGVIFGPSSYTPSSGQTKWVYDRTATTTSPCKWKCDTDNNYSKNGNTCTKNP
jgi:hypothetical protein